MRARLPDAAARLAEELRRDAVERLGERVSEKRPDEAITATVEENEQGVQISLHGNRSFFESLETGKGGERAVLTPVLEDCAPLVMKMFGNLFN